MNLKVNWIRVKSAATIILVLPKSQLVLSDLACNTMSVNSTRRIAIVKKCFDNHCTVWFKVERQWHLYPSFVIDVDRLGGPSNWLLGRGDVGGRFLFDGYKVRLLWRLNGERAIIIDILTKSMSANANIEWNHIDSECTEFLRLLITNLKSFHVDVCVMPMETPKRTIYAVVEW